MLCLTMFTLTCKNIISFYSLMAKIQHGKVLSFPPSSYSYEIMDIFSFVLETMLSFIIVFACWTAQRHQCLSQFHFSDLSQWAFLSDFFWSCWLSALCLLMMIYCFCFYVCVTLCMQIKNIILKKTPWQITSAAGVFVCLLEYPRSKRAKGTSVERT